MSPEVGFCFSLVPPPKRSEKGTTLGSAGWWVGRAQRPQDSPGPQVSLHHPFPGPRGPVSEGCGVWGGVLSPGSGFGVVSSALGCWGCCCVGARARSGRSRWALHPSGGETWQLQWSLVPRWQPPSSREASFCLVLLPLISLKRMGRAAHYLARHPFPVRTDPLNARF